MSGEPQISDEVLAEIRKAIFTGRKIQAIKLYREAVGCGLGQAKDVIEALQAKLREQEPQSFSAPRGSGCATVIAIVMGLGAIVAALLR